MAINDKIVKVKTNFQCYSIHICETQRKMVIFNKEFNYE